MRTKTIQSVHEYFYKVFCMQFPFIAKDVIKWCALSNHSIMLYLEDGTKMVYNDKMRTIAKVTPFDGTKEGWLRKFSYYLSEAMSDKGFDQTRLAKESGVTVSTICRYLGQDRMPTAYAVWRMAEALGVDVRYLMKFK